MSDGLAQLHQDLRDLVGQTIADRYRIDALIGVGGMAAVFRAHHLGLKRDVAVKILHPTLSANSEVSARFDREAESASRLDHPNIVQVTDFGSTEAGMKFMVMQLLEGGELAGRLNRRHAPVEVVYVALQLLRGLNHAHKQGVVHRDVKPENVFLTHDHEGREVVKLVDFGISKILSGSSEGHQTTAGLVFGTPAYMSPEQAAGVQADGRADLYSVGIIVYQMLAGRLPFVSDDPVALIRMQVGRDPEPLPAHVPPLLAGIVGRLLDKDRNQRFQTAREVIQTLEQILPMLQAHSVPGYIEDGPSVETPVSGGGIPDPIELRASGSLTSGSRATLPLPSGSSGDTGSLPYGQPLVMGESQLPVSPTSNERPASSVLSVPWGPLIGVVGVVLAIGIWMATRTREEPVNASPTEPLVEEMVAVESGTPDDDVLQADALTTVDTLVLGGKFAQAEELLKQLRQQFPTNADLMWREGRLLAKTKQRDQALTAYGNAVVEDPSLLNDRDFYAELYELLRTRRLRDQALELALQHLDSHGHKFLLELVNDSKRPLPYHDRQRALQELATDPDNQALIDDRLRRALDLVQASESKIPCVAYRDAIAEISAHPELYFLVRVQKAKVPEAPGPGIPGLLEDEPNACAELEQRREELLVVLEALGGMLDDEDDVELLEFESSSVSDPDCSRFGYWTRPQCFE